MSPLGCQKMSAKPCNRNAEESFPVLSLKSWEQKPPNPLLIQDKNVLQPSLGLAEPQASLGDQPARWANTVQSRGTSLRHTPDFYSNFTPTLRCLYDAPQPAWYPLRVSLR